MNEKLLLTNNATNMEKHKNKPMVSRDFAEKYLPHLDLEDPVATQAKLDYFIKQLKSAETVYDDLEEDFDREELQDAYGEYKNRLQQLLPPGYALQEVYDPKNSDLWRGTDPILIFSLLAAEKNKLKLSSTHPNVAHKWETSLSYGQGKANSKSQELPFVIALGFKKPHDFVSKRRDASDVYKDVIETASGTVNFSDAQELAIRFNGKRPGQVFPPKFYRIIPPKESLAA